MSSGGIFAAVLGGQSDDILAAIRDMDMVCAYGSHFRNRYAERLKEYLCGISGYDACLLFSTGSEAAEAWWRACRTATGKPAIWGGLPDPDHVGGDNVLPDAMHGWTLGSLIMSGKMSWPQWGLGYQSMLGAERTNQSQDITSCAIWEPYHAPSGQLHRTDPTINRLKHLQKEFPDILHCCDEVQGGLWRTGKLFAYQWYEGLRPDAIILGKALGGLPISALLGPKDIIGDPVLIEKACLHSTHSDNPVTAAAALTVLGILDDPDFQAEIQRKGELMGNLMNEWPVRVHHHGLLAGIQFADTEAADRVVIGCRQRGVWVIRTGRQWIKLGPAYVIDEADLRAAMERIGDAILDEVQR